MSMLTLHLLEGGGRGLEDAVLGIGILDPHPTTKKLVSYDFGLSKLVELRSEQVIAVAEGDPARVTFAPRLTTQATRVPMAANRDGKVVKFPLRRRPQPAGYTVTGYDVYAKDAALHWRKHGVGTQPVLAAGVFALSSIQTPIVTALRLFDMLGPYVLNDELPPDDDLVLMVQTSGAGLDDPQRGRPAWFRQFFDYRKTIVGAVGEGLRDNPLRRALAENSMPRGLGLAKLSFVLSLLGSDLGCLDARIVGWAFEAEVANAFLRRINRKRRNGSFGATTYRAYRDAELRILTRTPWYDRADPVGLARSQWILWEQLGRPGELHTHEELFRAVAEPTLGVS